MRSYLVLTGQFEDHTRTHEKLGEQEVAGSELFRGLIQYIFGFSGSKDLGERLDIVQVTRPNDFRNYFSGDPSLVDILGDKNLSETGGPYWVFRVPVNNPGLVENLLPAFEPFGVEAKIYSGPSVLWRAKELWRNTVGAAWQTYLRER